MADLETVRAEIDRARQLADRQRPDIIALQRAGRSTADAELVLSRQLARLDGLIGERNRITASRPSARQGKSSGAAGGEVLQRQSASRRSSRRSPRFDVEGWCYHHVQAIIVAIDRHAEADRNR